MIITYKTNNQKQGSTLVKLVAMISILSIFTFVLVPVGKEQSDNAIMDEITTICRELVIAVETYNSEVGLGCEIVNEFHGVPLAINCNGYGYRGKGETNLEDILRNVTIQQLLGDHTNNAEDKMKDPSDRLKKRFVRIPNKSKYSQIKKVAEGGKFAIDSQGMLDKVARYGSGEMEEIR